MLRWRATTTSRPMPSSRQSSARISTRRDRRGGAGPFVGEVERMDAGAGQALGDMRRSPARRANRSAPPSRRERQSRNATTGAV